MPEFRGYDAWKLKSPYEAEPTTLRCHHPKCKDLIYVGDTVVVSLLETFHEECWEEITGSFHTRAEVTKEGLKWLD